MAKNKLSDLRDHLFAQLEALRDSDSNLENEVKRAQAVSAISGSIIDAAKTEIRYLEAMGGEVSEFFDTPKRPQLPEKETTTRALVS